MRNIYPKLITTLFLILLAAVIIRYTDYGTHSDAGPNANSTAHLDKK